MTNELQTLECIDGEAKGIKLASHHDSSAYHYGGEQDLKVIYYKVYSDELKRYVWTIGK